MSRTHALQQFRIAVALAAREGAVRATESHWEEAGGLLLENASAAVTDAVADRIRSVLIRNDGSAKHYEIARSLSARNRAHMQRVIDELVASGSVTYDASTYVYRIAS